MKASAGAVEHLLLVPVDDLGGALADLRARGLRLVGADAGAPLTYREADLRGPLALVVGSEGRGLSGAVRRRLDLVVRIPMHGKVASLNAAVAGSVLLLEAATQRGLPDAPPAPEPDEAADEPGGRLGRSPDGGASPASRGPARQRHRRRVPRPRLPTSCSPAPDRQNQRRPSGSRAPPSPRLRRRRSHPQPAEAVRKPRARKPKAAPPAEPSEPA